MSMSTCSTSMCQPWSCQTYRCLLLPLDDVDHAVEVGRDVTVCLGPNGVVVDKVDQAVSTAVHQSTDECLIKQMCTADLRCVDFLEDVLCCRPLDDTQETSDVTDGQRLHR